MKTDIPASNSVHHLRPMRGRDPKQQHRTATPLESLFDLTFASCFGLVAAQFAKLIADGQHAAGLLAFGFASFAICWAWMNFSWFASAYDTDDWLFRLVTLLQMVGVLVLAIGIPRFFDSISNGKHLDNSVIIVGYVIMRVAMVFQWLRAARQNPSRRRQCSTYSLVITLAQAGWICQFLFVSSLSRSLAFASILILVELAGPLIAERMGDGTPWHARHIIERYNLFALIAFGEGVVATVEAVTAGVRSGRWNADSALVCIVGIGLTFEMWWVYDLMPSAEILQSHRNRAYIWGYVQIVLIASVVATGSGLLAAADYLGHKTRIGSLPTLLSVAVPLSLFLGLWYVIHYYLLRKSVANQTWLLVASCGVVATAVAAETYGVTLGACLVILALAPGVTILGYEIGAVSKVADIDLDQ